jgi:hypothetical protein
MWTGQRALGVLKQLMNFAVIAGELKHLNLKTGLQSKRGNKETVACLFEMACL